MSVNTRETALVRYFEGIEAGLELAERTAVLAFGMDAVALASEDEDFGLAGAHEAWNIAQEEATRLAVTVYIRHAVSDEVIATVYPRAL